MSAAFKTKIDCISFVVQGMDYFGNDSANFLPVPTCHGVGMSGASLRVFVVQSAHLTVGRSKVYCS